MPSSRAIVEGSLPLVMFSLALPVLAEQILNTFVGLFDTGLAGRIPGYEVHATAAVGLAAYVSWLVSMLFLLVGTGTTALVSRCAGMEDWPEANRLTNQALLLAGFMGLTGFLLIYTLAPWFARWQNMTPTATPIVVRYLRIESFAHVATALTLVGGAALRGGGDMRTPLYILAVVNMLNVIVSLTLVYGLGPAPALGVDGIVAGTVTARVCGALILIAVLIRGRSGLTLRAEWVRLHLGRARRIIRIGVPAALDGAALWTGHFVFLMIVARLAEGRTGMLLYAAHIVVIRLEAFTYLPAQAWATSSATMIGQALGAARPARARKVAHVAVAQCAVLSVAIGLAFYYGAESLSRVMNRDAGVLGATVPVLRLVAPFQVFLSASIIYTQALRGAGDTRYPFLYTLLTLLLLRLPLGYVLGITWGYGLTGAWMAICADMVARAALPGIRYARGRWVATKV